MYPGTGESAHTVASYVRLRRPSLSISKEIVRLPGFCDFLIEVKGTVFSLNFIRRSSNVSVTPLPFFNASAAAIRASLDAHWRPVGTPAT